MKHEKELCRMQRHNKCDDDGKDQCYIAVTATEMMMNEFNTE